MAARNQWRSQAEKDLKGRSLDSLTRMDPDGLAVLPLYTAHEAVAPVYAPRCRTADGRAWDLRTLCEGDDPAAVNMAALGDLAGGAASAVLTGAVLADAEPLGRALQGVALELAAVGLDAGLSGPGAANALAVVAKGSPRARLLFHLDPLSAFAEAGGSPRPIDEHIMLAANTASRHAPAYPEAGLFLASGRVVHEAGGSMAQELAFATAAALAYAKACDAAGLGAQIAFERMSLGVALDARYLDSLAKVRALRLMWASLTEACGVSAAATIEARSSRRMMSAVDPWPNLLRLTAAGFAGAVGGADAVLLEGFSNARGVPDASARRQARNTHLVLMEEAHLGRVDDPAAGAWFLDARTRQLAQAGWAAFQRIETEGGVVAALKSGLIQDTVEASRDAYQAALAAGDHQLVGVSRFVDPEPRAVATGDRTVEPADASGDACRALVPLRWAQALETGQ